MSPEFRVGAANVNPAGPHIAAVVAGLSGDLRGAAEPVNVTYKLRSDNTIPCRSTFSR